VSRFGKAIVAFVAAGALLGSSRARAIETDLEIGMGVAQTALGNVTLVSPLLGLGVPINADAGMIVKWGFTIASADSAPAGDNATRFQIGNPYVGFPLRFAEGLVFAPGLALPVSSQPAAPVEVDGVTPPPDPDAAIANIAVNGSRALRGTIDQWLWLADQLSLVFPLHWVSWSDPILIEVDLKIAYIIGVQEVDKDDDFILQATSRVAWRIVPRLWLGARFGAVYIPTNTGDNASLSLEPDVRYMMSPRGHVEARFLFNLDGPFGPSFTSGRVWGAHVGFGWTF